MELNSIVKKVIIWCEFITVLKISKQHNTRLIKPDQKKIFLLSIFELISREGVCSLEHTQSSHHTALLIISICKFIKNLMTLSLAFPDLWSDCIPSQPASLSLTPRFSWAFFRDDYRCVRPLRESESPNFKISSNEDINNSISCPHQAQLWKYGIYPNHHTYASCVFVNATSYKETVPWLSIVNTRK